MIRQYSQQTLSLSHTSLSVFQPREEEQPCHQLNENSTTTILLLPKFQEIINQEYLNGTKKFCHQPAHFCPKSKVYHQREGDVIKKLPFCEEETHLIQL